MTKKGVSFIVLMVILASGIFFGMIRHQVSFMLSATRLLKENQALVKKAEAFDEEKALTELKDNTMNQFYYRFDDHINEAVHDSNKEKFQVREESESLSFEFDGKDPIVLDQDPKKFIIEDGILKTRAEPGDYLENKGSLAIKSDRIGEILLRAKVKNATRIEIVFHVENIPWREITKSERRTILKRKIVVDTVSDNQFHIYKISALESFMFSKVYKYGDVLEKLVIFPTNKGNDEVEIDYVRLISKGEKYREQDYGVAYEIFHKEMRKTIYSHAPSSIKYKVSLPSEKIYLSFGMGVLEKDRPVEFSITLAGKARKQVFLKEVGATNLWHDEKIDLSSWKGEEVDLIFETKSELGNIAFWSNPIVYTIPKERFNVIILLEDTLRADHMSSYGYQRETTPVKDEFIKSGVIFLNAFSQATKTRPSLPSLMTSLDPIATGVELGHQHLSDRYLTLAETMRSQGFATASFIQNSNAGARAGLHQGFSHLFDFETMGHRAETMYSETLYGMIEKIRERNFFAYVHILDPHGVYDPPPPFDAWYQNAPPGKTIVTPNRTSHDPEWEKVPTLEGRRLLYDGEIRYNDFWFEKFLERMKGYGILDNTLLVFISDHGEHLGEHNQWEHHDPGYIQVIKVPLLMIYPRELPKNRRIKQPVQLIDIVPTILDLAKIDTGDLLLQGDSLIPLIFGRNLGFWDNRISISSERVTWKNGVNGGSAIYKQWHILNSPRVNGPLVFDYWQDKEELHPIKYHLFDSHFKRYVQNFLMEYQGYNKNIHRAMTKGIVEVVEYDPVTLEQLRSLGYLQ